MSGLQPFSLCLVPLELVFEWEGGFVQHKGYSCCRDCEMGVPAGQIGRTVVEFKSGNLPLSPMVRVPPHWPRPGMVIWTRNGGVHDSATRDWCGDFRTSDLEGSNLAELERFLDQLVFGYGYTYGLDPNSSNPRDVCLHVSQADPPVKTDPQGNQGIVAGEISCARGAAAIARNCRYQITLYKRAFSGQCAQLVYNTVAHEFKHILQSIELNLPTGSCDQPPSNQQQYEQEADEFAKPIAPDCSGCP